MRPPYIFSCSIDQTSFENLLGVCNKNWSNQVRDVVLALVLNAILVIWQCRNKRRFEDYDIPFPRAINIISSSVSLSGRFSKGAMSSSIDEFLILKCFSVGGHPPKVPMIKQVICDSSLVVAAFQSGKGIPWKLRNRWSHCLALTRRMNFFISHIYREGNTSADRMAAHGLTIQGDVWWDSIPNFIGEDFFRNQFSLPFYRFRP